MTKFRWIRISSAALATATLLVVGGGVAANAAPKPAPVDWVAPVDWAPVDWSSGDRASTFRAPVDW
ncbi:hypothetical protein [Microbacterium sp. JZ31]|uniref:hypothetical protein n=1 Tax=Microbacterium sp. JZ31 TaxID=1906274 RepID=UPI0019321D26|nr:hypothetical protein [Microbacterium sp. JZ31]